MADPYGLAYALFLIVFSLLFICEWLPCVRGTAERLGNAVQQNVIEKFQRQRCPSGLEPVKDPDAKPGEKEKTEGSKRYICCGEARDARIEKYLSSPHYYFGIDDFMFPNGEVSILGLFTLRLSPGMAEDFVYYVFNNDPLISCFAADRSNLNSTLIRKFLWLYDHSFAFLLFCIFDAVPGGTALQIFLGLFMSFLSYLNRLMFTCPCLVGTHFDCFRICCRAYVYLTFIYFFGLAMTFIFLGVSELKNNSSDDEATGKVGQFYAIVIILDTLTRCVLLVLTFNSAGGMELKLCKFVVFARGEWLIEKYSIGCIPIEDIDVSSKTCCCCFTAEATVSKKIMTRVNDAKSMAGDKIREVRAISGDKMREVQAVAGEKIKEVRSMSSGKPDVEMGQKAGEDRPPEYSPATKT